MHESCKHDFMLNYWGGKDFTVKYLTIKSNVYNLIKYTILLKYIYIYMIMTESIRSFQMIHLLKIYDHLFKSIQFSEISI